jgi:hypothetical protein
VHDPGCADGQICLNLVDGSVQLQICATQTRAHSPVGAIGIRSTTRSYGIIAAVTRQFHIEDRARGRVVATGEIDANGLVTWGETEASVSEELSDLAEEIQQHIAAGYSGGQLRPPLEWFEL